MLYMVDNPDSPVGSSEFLGSGERLVQKHTCWSGVDYRNTLASALVVAGDWAGANASLVGDKGHQRK